MYIYGLVDPITNQLRYVGKTKMKLDARIRKHLNKANLRARTLKINWIKSLLKQNLKPNIVIIQQFNEPDILNQAEIHWIKYFKDMGCQLTNHTKGGDGGPVDSDTRKRASFSKSNGKINELTELYIINSYPQKDMRTIAKELGVYHQAVSKCLDRNGIPRRKMIRDPQTGQFKPIFESK